MHPLPTLPSPSLPTPLLSSSGYTKVYSNVQFVTNFSKINLSVHLCLKDVCSHMLPSSGCIRMYKDVLHMTNFSKKRLFQWVSTQGCTEMYGLQQLFPKFTVVQHDGMEKCSDPLVGSGRRQRVSQGFPDTFLRIAGNSVIY